MNAAIPPPEPGWTNLNWGVIEWITTGLAAISTAVSGWVWGIATKLERLNMRIERLTKDVGDARDLAATAKEEATSLRQKLDDLHRDMPSRNFIETQLNQQTSRIDQLMASKLGHS